MTELARILTDFGLVVLTWMVQLVVYPGFRFYARQDMLRWHETYTWRITVIVFPLMALQLGLYTYLAFTESSLLSLVQCLLVVLTWLITFFLAVPLHNRIAGDQEMQEAIARLNMVHTSRTLIWTTVFLISASKYLGFI